MLLRMGGAHLQTLLGDKCDHKSFILSTIRIVTLLLNETPRPVHYPEIMGVFFTNCTGPFRIPVQ